MLRKYKDYILLLLLFLVIIFISNISYFNMPNNIDINVIVDDYTKYLESEYNVHIEIQQNQSGIYDRYKLKITGYLM